MAKGQKRSGREPKKPKKSQQVTTSAATKGFDALKARSAPAKPPEK
jgi:hypothetical protein